MEKKIHIDTEYKGKDSDGSKEKPFKSLAEAFEFYNTITLTNCIVFECRGGEE